MDYMRVVSEFVVILSEKSIFRQIKLSVYFRANCLALGRAAYAAQIQMSHGIYTTSKRGRKLSRSSRGEGRIR